jgi:membrane-associated protease RseP (regulator of RpoE activity)
LILAIINVVLGIINGLPLFPLDGGHFAVALYEKLSGRTADVRKLIPVAVVVIAFISIFGLAAIILDLVQPIDL